MKHKKIKFYILFTLLNLTINSVFSQTPPLDVFSPTFSHLSGRYNNDIQVQLATRTDSSKIYYTLDGSTPDSTSQLYTGNILISGDGTIKTIRAITIEHDSLKSRISSSIYVIDYSFNPNAAYLTNLTLSDYNNFMIGDWVGYANTPWTNNYSIKLSILSNGNYIDTTTSSSVSLPFSDYFHPVFYYGIPDVTPYKIISLGSILISGYANGFVDIDFGISTNHDELRYIKFIDNKNLYLEMWHHSTYGPLKYFLTKVNSSITTEIKENIIENTSVFPNPTSDFLVIKNLNSNVTLINQFGQSFIFERKEIITVSHLPKGLYVLIFKNIDGIQIKQKLILE